MRRKAILGSIIGGLALILVNSGEGNTAPILENEACDVQSVVVETNFNERSWSDDELILNVNVPTGKYIGDYKISVRNPNGTSIESLGTLARFQYLTTIRPGNYLYILCSYLDAITGENVE